MHLGCFFLEVIVQNVNIYGVAKISNILVGML